MTKLLFLALAITAGFVCFGVAKKEGLRYPGLWFIAGIFFHVFAIAAVLYIQKYIARRKGDAT